MYIYTSIHTYIVFGPYLGGGEDGESAVVGRRGECGAGLEVEVLLPAHSEFASHSYLRDETNRNQSILQS